MHTTCGQACNQATSAGSPHWRGAKFSHSSRQVKHTIIWHGRLDGQSSTLDCVVSLKDPLWQEELRQDPWQRMKCSDSMVRLSFKGSTLERYASGFISFKGINGETTPLRTLSFKGTNREITPLRSISFKGIDLATTAIGSISFKGRELEADSMRLDSSNERAFEASSVGSGSFKEEAAAVKLQKIYKSYRTRRNLADCAVQVEELWFVTSHSQILMV